MVTLIFTHFGYFMQNKMMTLVVTYFGSMQRKMVTLTLTHFGYMQNKMVQCRFGAQPYISMLEFLVIFTQIESYKSYFSS